LKVRRNSRSNIFIQALRTASLIMMKAVVIPDSKYISMC